MIVDEQMKHFINTEGIKVILSDKIFLHEEDDRRVTYSQISSFYEMLTGKTLNKKEQ